MNKMNEITINNYTLPIKEYAGQRVVTFKEIDSVHKRAKGTARKRFNDNREHFIEGVDFYKVHQASEIRTLGITRPQGGVPEEVMLITESGYLMLVKSFTDDLAWTVQRELVNCYFRVKQIPQERQCKPTRPLTTDDYEDAARTIAKCHNSRLPIVIDLYRKAGLDIGKIPEIQEQKKIKNLKDDKYFIELLNQYGIKELVEKLGISRTSIYYYRIGKYKPNKKRKELIIKILTEDDKNHL